MQLYTKKTKALDNKKDEENNGVILVGIAVIILFGLSRIAVGTEQPTEYVTVDIIINE